MATPAEQAAQLQPGDVVAERYVVERLLGRGGMGEVYVALDTKLERRVALKIVVAAASADARRRLEAEAKAVAALEHPGIVTLHDVLEHGALVVLVLELVQGQSLRTMIERHPLDLTTAARVISGVADALEAAHARGFIHRDVKPDNVILRPDGRTVLLDFGIAKAPARGSPLAATVTADGALFGTPAYLAPEQIRDEAVSAASDQFALAVMAYELCTGSLPWNATSVSAIIASIVSDPPRAFHEPVREEDSAIDAVFARALDKNPAERYASVSAFATALAEALGTTEPLDRPGRNQREGSDEERKARREMRTLTAPDDAGSVSEDATEPASLAPHPPAGLREAGRRRRNVVWLGVGALLLAAGSLAIGLTVKHGPASAGPVASSSAGPADGAAALLPDELPASLAPSEEDRVGYRDAIRTLRRGDIEAALREFDAIIGRSPDFAGAQLMRAYTSFLRAFDLDEAGRAAFRAASAKRDGLSDRDRQLLEALAPSFLDPPRWRETAELMETFVRDRPRDVLGWEVLGFARTKLGDYATAEITFAKEIELDRHAALAYDLEAQFAIVKGDDARAKALLETCAEQDPAAVRCRVDVSVLLASTGHCAEADREARDILAIDPESPRALAVRARANAALGAPNEIVSGFLDKRRKSIPKELLRAAELEDAVLLAKRTGDFATALAALDSVSKTETGLTSTDASRFTLVLAETLWETGQKHQAADVAKSYLRMEATRPLPERGVTDATGRMLMFMLDAADISQTEHDARRDEWVKAWRARRTEIEWRTEVGMDIWRGAYGPIGTPTADEARAALEAAKDMGIDVTPRRSVNVDPTQPDADAQVGRLLFAAGRLDEAEKALRMASSNCAIAPDEGARLALGDLLAQRGKKADACSSYAAIEKDWGHAKPHSVTAEAARAAAAKLQCPP